MNPWNAARLLCSQWTAESQFCLRKQAELLGTKYGALQAEHEDLSRDNWWKLRTSHNDPLEMGLYSPEKRWLRIFHWNMRIDCQSWHGCQGFGQKNTTMVKQQPPVTRASGRKLPSSKLTQLFPFNYQRIIHFGSFQMLPGFPAGIAAVPRRGPCGFGRGPGTLVTGAIFFGGWKTHPRGKPGWVVYST